MIQDDVRGYPCKSGARWGIGAMIEKEIIQLVLDLIDKLNRWPLAVVIIVWLLRGSIKAVIPDLAKRMKKVTVPGGSVEFWEQFKEVAKGLDPETLKNFVLQMKTVPPEDIEDPNQAEGDEQGEILDSVRTFSRTENSQE